MLLAAVMLSAQATDRASTRRPAPVRDRGRPQKMLDLGIPRSRTLSRRSAFPQQGERTCTPPAASSVGRRRQGAGTREALEALPASAARPPTWCSNVAFGESTLAVDTHVFRVSNRTGLAHRPTARSRSRRA
jgi:endonuclease-3